MGATMREDRFGVINLTLTPASVSNVTAPSQTFTVPGLKLNDFVVLVPAGGVTAGVAVANARVSAADTLSVQFVNPTAGSLTPAAGSYLLLWVRPERITTGLEMP